ncbi:hypothetical protein Kisp01_07740 [Kineosporia sp. NBRC 101677]|nr:hypothetical protein Kisp01_07740 [Kineosporia sp. NBRC 101677]
MIEQGASAAPAGEAGASTTSEVTTAAVTRPAVARRMFFMIAEDRFESPRTRPFPVNMTQNTTGLEIAAGPGVLRADREVWCRTAADQVCA